MSSSLFRRAWQPRNREALLSFVRRGRSEQATAALDWDNTCIFGDIGDACFRFLLRHGAVTKNVDEMAALLPTQVTGHTNTASGNSLANLREDILESYRALLDAQAKALPRGRKAGAKKSPAAFDTVEHPSSPQKDFSCRVLALYEALLATPGVDAAEVYAFQVRFFSGLAPRALKMLVDGALAQAQRAETKKVTWTSDAHGACGRSSVGFDPRIRAIPEMQDLVSMLTRYGILPHVVSASFEPLVEHCVKALGYAVPAVHVFGMRLAQAEPDGVYLPRAQEHWPLTYRAGKVACIRKNLPEPPSFVAGDHLTDYEMLTGFAETRMRLIIDRRSTLPQMQSLYALARAPQHAKVAGTPGVVTTLLQKRDENKSGFCPT